MDEQQLESQVDQIIALLGKRTLAIRSEPFKVAANWLKNFPKGLPVYKRRMLMEAICRSCQISEAALISLMDGTEISLTLKSNKPPDEQALWDLIPNGGFLEWYCTHTSFVESPLSFHVICALATCGAALGRRVYKDMGPFRVYPNIRAILMGPPARVKKTTAVDIAKGFIEHHNLMPIMAEKITPESLATNLASKGGVQFIYAPEFSMFFGKQKYLEGLTTLILRILDDPDRMPVSTQTRGEEVVENLAVTLLGASTLSLLNSSSASETTSSGFLSRFLISLEHDTSRIFPEPKLGPSENKEKLDQTIKYLQGLEGEMVFNAECRAFYNEWYFSRKNQLKHVDSETAVEIMERGATHVVKIALNIHASQCEGPNICKPCMEHSIKLLEYFEGKLPDLVRALDRSSHGLDVSYVVKQLDNLGGAADHSTLLRRVSSRLSADQLKRIMVTLEECGYVKISKQNLARYYITVKGGQEHATGTKLGTGSPEVGLHNGEGHALGSVQNSEQEHKPNS